MVIKKPLIGNCSYSISEGELLDRVRKYNLQKAKRKAKIVCYSAIDARDDELIIPETIYDDFDYVVFTHRRIEGDHIFEIHKSPFLHKNPIVSARYLKTHPHILFPHYQYAVWIDPYIMIKGFELYDNLTRCVRENISLMINVHNRYKSVHQRFESGLLTQKGAPKKVSEQLSKYFDEGLPKSTSFYDTGIVIRSTGNPEINKANEAWWNEILNGVKGDQFSLPYIVWKYDLPTHQMAGIKNAGINKTYGFRIIKNDLYGKTNAPTYKTPSFLCLGPVPDFAKLSSSLLQENRRHEARQVAELKIKLYRYGFVDKSIRNLTDLAGKSQKPALRQRALKVLAMWHAGRHTLEDAQKCLSLIEQADTEKSWQEYKTAILKAECYYRIGDLRNAEKVLTEKTESEPSPDLFLAMSAISVAVNQKVFWLNKVYEWYNTSAIFLLDDKWATNFDRLYADPNPESAKVRGENYPTVSILVSAYNSEDTIHTALESILHQTWKNLEIIVVDDCSTDNTLRIIKGFAEKDPRVKFLRLNQNRGAYVARNHALKIATGQFVTCHDADDWSHPEKTAMQARHLQQHKSIIANTSEFIRVTHDLSPYRKPNSEQYIRINYSSLMFRRKEVMNALGYWDSVRFGADSEMVFRMKKHFGEEKVGHMKTGPLMLALQSEKTLTGDQSFGIHGYLNGARAEYNEGFLDNLCRGGDLNYPFPMTKRMFAIPEPLKPEAKNIKRNIRHFDTIIAFDFRLEGEISAAIAREILSLSRQGRLVGLVQLCIWAVEGKKHPKIGNSIRKLINNENAQLIVYGEHVSCHRLLVKHPATLMYYQVFVPEVKVDNLIIETGHEKNQYDDFSYFEYDKKNCEENLQRYFHKNGRWIEHKSREND